MLIFWKEEVRYQELISCYRLSEHFAYSALSSLLQCKSILKMLPAADSWRPKATPMKKILVLCTGNSCRSQIAEGYLRKSSGEKALVYSAGVETHGVNPKAITIMAEDGIDISGHTSNNIEEYIDIDFDFVITVCDNAKERCPYLPTEAKKFHHNFPDPAKASGSDDEVKQEFRAVREMIRDFCEDFVKKNL